MCDHPTLGVARIQLAHRRYNPCRTLCCPGKVTPATRVEGAGGPLDIAAHLPSGSLPELFRRSSAAFGATTSPYLVADPVARGRFRDHYADGRKLVGLAWRTKNRKT
jgi:hypothetical protein